MPVLMDETELIGRARELRARILTAESESDTDENAPEGG
jgi:hypothetical protein